MAMAAKATPEKGQKEANSQKRAKVPQTEFPNNNLETSMRIAQALWDHYAGKGAPPHDVAMALDLSPTSGGWRNLCGSSIAYGLTEGGYAAEEILLSALGRRVVAPEEDGDDAAALVEAILSPRIMSEFFQKYDKAKFPRDDIAKNVLVGMGLPKDRTEKAFEILRENGNFAGIIRDTKTGPFVALGARPVLQRKDESDVQEDDDATDPEILTPDDPSSATPQTPRAKGPEGPKQIFVAHGKNRKPLEELKKILDKFKVPYKVAVDEPHAGRPISQKVADLMKSCSAGIFIFTKDEKFIRDGGEEVWRPSENVVYELGAGSILWGKKIIILREDGVNFPSDFSDLGYVTFDDGALASRGLEIFGELVAFEFVKVQAA